MRMLGVDPGSASPSGAIYQALAGANGSIIHAFDVPMTGERGESSWRVDVMGFVDVIQTWGVTHATMERVWAMPSREDEATGVRRGMGVSSAFNFGVAFGDLRTTVRLCGFEPTFVVPTVWKKCFGLFGPGKEQSRQLALELFPQAAQFLPRKKDEGRAEAMLIARWGVMNAEGRFASVGKTRAAAKPPAALPGIDDEIEE